MGYSAATAKAFISKIAPLMQAEANRRGYRICSTAIAQAIIESAAGSSVLGYKYHNYFGMKCGASWRGASVNLSTKEEYTAGTLTSIKANFRAYKDMAAGVSGYYDFISYSRYANLKTASTPQQYAERLKADGYATSSTYVSTLVSTVKKYGLERYDIAVIDEVYDMLPTIKKGSNGTAVKLWQVIIGAKIDGDFGADTERMTKAWQSANGLYIDGIVGVKTWTAALNKVG